MEKYAARRGYSATTLRKWIATAEKLAGARPAAAPALVRVVARSAATEVVVEVGAARIRVGGAFDAALLRSVVSALSEQGS